MRHGNGRRYEAGRDQVRGSPAACTLLDGILRRLSGILLFWEILMPHLFMHIQHGDELIEDPDGQEFASLDDAKACAIAAARELMVAQLLRGEPLDGHKFKLTDRDGETVMVVPFRDAMPPR